MPVLGQSEGATFGHTMRCSQSDGHLYIQPALRLTVVHTLQVIKARALNLYLLWITWAQSCGAVDSWRHFNDSAPAVEPRALTTGSYNLFIPPQRARALHSPACSTALRGYNGFPLRQQWLKSVMTRALFDTHTHDTQIQTDLQVS